MSDPDDPQGDQLSGSVRRRRERRERWLREGERPMGRNLALIGALGWLVVVPTLAGLFAGHWLDDRAGGGLFWTAALLVVGVALGGWLAWHRIEQER